MNDLNVYYLLTTLNLSKHNTQMEKSRNIILFYPLIHTLNK